MRKFGATNTTRMDNTASRSRRANNTNILSGTAGRIGKAPWTSNRFMRMMVNKKAAQKIIKPRRWGLRNPEEYFNHADSPGSLRSFIHESPTPPQRQPRDNVLPGQYDVYERSSLPRSLDSEHGDESGNEDAPTADYMGSQSPPLVTRSIVQETVPVNADMMPLVDHEIPLVPDDLSDHEDWFRTRHPRGDRLIYHSPVRLDRDSEISKRLTYTTYGRDPVRVMNGTPRRKFYTIRTHKSLPIDEYTMPSSPVLLQRQPCSPYNRKKHAKTLPVDRLDDGIGVYVKEPSLDNADSHGGRYVEEEGYVSDGDSGENKALRMSSSHPEVKQMLRRRSSTLPGGSIIYHPAISEDQEEYIDVEQNDSPSPREYEETAADYIRARQGNISRHQREDQSTEARLHMKTPPNLYLQPLDHHVLKHSQKIASRRESSRLHARKSESTKTRKSRSDLQGEDELLPTQLDLSTESQLDYEDSDSDCQRRSFQFEKARRKPRNSYDTEWDRRKSMPRSSRTSDRHTVSSVRETNQELPSPQPQQQQQQEFPEDSMEGSEAEEENVPTLPRTLNRSGKTGEGRRRTRDTEWDRRKSMPRSSRTSDRHTVSSVRETNQELPSPQPQQQQQQEFPEDSMEGSEAEEENVPTLPRTLNRSGKTGEGRRRTRASYATEPDIQKESDAQVLHPRKKGRYSLRASNGSYRQSLARDSEIPEKSLSAVEATYHAEAKSRKPSLVSQTTSTPQEIHLEEEEADEEDENEETREKSVATTSTGSVPKSKKKRRRRICYRSPSHSKNPKPSVKETEKKDTATASATKRSSAKRNKRNAEKSTSARKSAAPSGSVTTVSKRKSIIKPSGLSVNITPIPGDARRVSFAPNCEGSPGHPYCHSTPLVRQKTKTRRVEEDSSTHEEQNPDNSSALQLLVQHVLQSPTLPQHKKGGKVPHVKGPNQQAAFKYPYELVREEEGSQGYAFCYFEPKAAERVAEERTPGLRRSKRNRVPRLCRWRGDQVEYEYTKEGRVVKSVRLGMKKSEEAKEKNAKNQKKAKELCEELKDAEIEINPKIPVLTLEGMEIEEDVVCTEEMTNLTKRGPGLFVHKFFRSSDFGYGKLVIGPNAEKCRQHVKADRMVFLLFKGHIMLSIHTTALELKTGASFTVPPGNIYGIKNLQDSKAVLFFTQVKARE